MKHPVDIVFFSSPAEFGRWLRQNHAKAQELWVGFHKRKTGRPTLTWPESVDEALCYGWIDGIRKSIDADRYTIRFTPRKRGSTWSSINVARVKELIRTRRLRAAGRKAFESRDPARTGIYSFEQRPQRLAPEFEKHFRRNKAAWQYFTGQAPWYQRTAIFWVMSAKKEETRSSRLATLIQDSANQKPIKPLTRPSGPGKGNPASRGDKTPGNP